MKTPLLRSNLRKMSIALIAAILVPCIGRMSHIALAGNGTEGGDICGNPDSDSPCEDCDCPDEEGPADGGASTSASGEPVNFQLNSAVERIVDLQLPGTDLSWSHVRTYDSRVARATGSFVDLEGVRWHGGGAGPFLRHPLMSDTPDDLELYTSATSKRTFTYNSGNYDPPADSPLTLVKSGSGASEIFTLTNLETGRVLIFYGLDSNIATKNQGRIKERTTRAFQAASRTGTTYSYTSFDMLDWVLTSDGQYIDYEYYTFGADTNRLETISVYAGANAGTTLLQQAQYMYFDSAVDESAVAINASSDVGQSGDLIQVKVIRRATNDTGSNLSLVRTTQYRYFVGENDHQIKAVIESDAIERLLQDNSNLSSPEDILEQDDSYATGSASSNSISAFASRAFTHYDTNRLATSSAITTAWGTETLSGPSGKYGSNSYNDGEYSEWDITGSNSYGYWDGAVKSESIQGGCSTCGGPTAVGVKRDYYYIELADWYHGDGKTDPNMVVRIVIQDTKDAAGTPLYRRLYGVNWKGTAIREAFVANPTNPTASTIWCTSLILNSDWRVIERREPSAHKTLVSDNATLTKFLDPTGNSGANDTDTVNASSGLVYHTEFNPTYGSGKRPTGQLVSIGTSGTKHYIAATNYGDGDGDSTGQDNAEGKLATAQYVYPTQTATRSAGVATTMVYTFWDSSDTAVRSIVSTLPTVSTGENGSGSTTVTTGQYFDRLGRLRWTKDGEGYVNYYSYHPVTGALAFTAVDVDPTSAPTGATGNDTKWVSWNEDGDGASTSTYDSAGKPSRGSLPTALAIVSSSEFDEQGRPRLRTDPPTEVNTAGAKHYMAYEKDGDVERIIVFPFWNSTTDQSRLPTQVTESNAGGTLIARYTVAAQQAGNAGDPPVALGNLESATKKSLTKYSYSTTGLVSEVQRYHDTTGTTAFDDYYSTRYLYDAEGKVGVTIQDVASGKYQVTVTLRDVLGRPIETRRAVTSTAPTATNFATLTGSLPSGYAVVSTTTYDGGVVGDGHVTKSRTYHTAGSGAKYTDSLYKRTYRGHLRGVERQHYSGSTADVKPYHVFDVDWLGRTTATAAYTTEPSTWPSDYTQYVHNANPSSPSPTTSGHYELQVSYYDVLGRVFRTERYPGTVTTGRIQKNNYYDRRDLLVCTGDQHGAHMEYVYDGARRRFEERTIKDVQATKYNSGAFNYCEPDIADPTGGDEGVVHMVRTDLNAVGDATGVHEYEMTHTDANGISLSDTTSFVRRTQYSWYDAADRLVATADYGSGDGTSTSVLNWKYTSVPTRPSSAPTWDSSEISNGYVHLTTYGYDAAARQDAVTIGVRWMGSSSTETYVTKSFYDDLGRRRFFVENDLGSNPLSGSPTSGTDTDRTTGWIYDGLDNVAQLIAYNSDSTSQTTNYYYTDPYNATLVTYTTYPDSSSTPSSGTDLVKRDYDLDGRVNKAKDQRGVEHTYTYTASRLVELDDVTNLPSGVDGAVRSIKHFYDDLERLTYVNSYPNVNAGGTLANFVGFAYSAGGNVRYLHQAHDGTWTNVQTFDHVNDNNATSGLIYNGARLTKLVYPNGAIVEYGHGAAPWYNQGNIGDRLSQVTTMTFTPPGGSAAEVAAYKYNGVDRLVETDYTVPDVRRRMFAVDSAGTNDYNGWDRFGRTVRHQWQDYTSTVVTRDRFDYENDYAGNRVHRANAVASTGHDQIYGYDRMMRLATMEEGTMSGGSLTGTHTFDEGWTLDALGNWGAYTQSVNGTTTLDQARSHNVVNEIDVNISDTDSPGASITASVGANWADPSYDAAGNMDSLPQTYAPTSSYTLVYDAWNRLVSVYDNAISQMVSKMQYDGLNRLIIKETNFEHLGGFETRHYYYNIDWQVVEERIGATGSATVVAQYVWHPHYVDAIAMRRYDSDRDGNLAEGHDGDHYYLQDANYNVTAVLNASGFALERYAYTPYGKPTTLNGASGVDPDGSVGEFDVDISYSVMRDTFSDIGNAVLYTGRDYDWETGLQINRHRYYAAHLGRWLTRDPLDRGGMNLYELVRSRPLNSLDPSGLCELVRGEYYFKQEPNWKKGQSGGYELIYKYEKGCQGDDCCSVHFSGELVYENRTNAFDNWAIGAVGMGFRIEAKEEYNDLGCPEGKEGSRAEVIVTFTPILSCGISLGVGPACIEVWHGDLVNRDPANSMPSHTKRFVIDCCQDCCD
jgi:RHS repeat-associated protein